MFLRKIKKNDSTRKILQPYWILNIRNPVQQGPYTKTIKADILPEWFYASKLN